MIVHRSIVLWRAQALWEVSSWLRARLWQDPSLHLRYPGGCSLVLVDNIIISWPFTSLLPAPSWGSFVSCILCWFNCVHFPSWKKPQLFSADHYVSQWSTGRPYGSLPPVSLSFMFKIFLRILVLSANDIKLRWVLVTMSHDPAVRFRNRSKGVVPRGPELFPVAALDFAWHKHWNLFHRKFYIHFHTFKKVVHPLFHFNRYFYFTYHMF